MAINASAELSVLQAVAQFLTYAVMAVFAENAVFFRALGVSRLNKLVNDPKISTWQYCIPIILVQTISAPMGWAAQSLTLPALAKVLPGWLPVQSPQASSILLSGSRRFPSVPAPADFHPST